MSIVKSLLPPPGPPGIFAIYEYQGSLFHRRTIFSSIRFSSNSCAIICAATSSRVCCYWWFALSWENSLDGIARKLFLHSLTFWNHHQMRKYIAEEKIWWKYRLYPFLWPLPPKAKSKIRSKAKESPVAPFWWKKPEIWDKTRTTVNFEAWNIGQAKLIQIRLATCGASCSWGLVMGSLDMGSVKR